MAKEVIIELKAKTDKIEQDVEGINKEIKTLNKNDPYSQHIQNNRNCKIQNIKNNQNIQNNRNCNIQNHQNNSNIQNHNNFNIQNNQK